MNTHPNLLSVANSLLVVVDVQVKLAAVMPEGPTLMKHIATLLDGAQRLFVPVVVTEQYPKGLGHTEPSVIRLLPENTAIFEKTGFSCFAAEGFAQALQSSGRKQIILVGMETHVCVLQTALALLINGFQVYVVEDVVCSRNANHKDQALKRMQNQGVTVTNYESVLFEWLRDAAHPEFKYFSRLLR